MSEPLRLSASQLKLFQRCKRAWYYRYVEKAKVERKPWLKLGVEFHECIENKYRRLLKEKVEDGIYDTHLVQLVDDAWEKGILYVPRKFIVEGDIKIQINENTHMIGKADLVDVSEGKIIDHKTIKSTRYALTEDDLREDLQLNIYGYWYLLKLPKKDYVWYRHNQLHKMSSDLSTFTEVKVSRAYVEKYWEFTVMPIVHEVEKYSKHTDKKKFPCSTNKCSEFGGCDYKYCCERSNSLNL